MPESNFVDYVKIYCRSGKGGRGSMHLRHVKYNPNGGPDGGDGGKGGSIYLRGNHNYWTLLHLKYQRHVFAEHGGNGGRDKCHGTDGKDQYIDVPCGTVVYNAETGKYVCDVTYDGQTVLLLKGGRGGLGNFQFRSATNQAPRYAQPGEPMEEMTIILELKLLADVGLVGFPNAGKSTLLKIITGLLNPTSGEIYFEGHKWTRADLADIGALIETPPIYENLTAWENMKVRALLLGIPDEKIQKVLKTVDLTDTGKKKAGAFSLGMKQRLGIGLALLNDPKLLVLDEPVNGLDPLGIQELRALIRSFPEKGITVIISSHILSEIQQTADYIGIIAKGTVGFEGKLQEQQDLEALFMKVVAKGGNES